MRWIEDVWGVTCASVGIGGLLAFSRAAAERWLGVDSLYANLATIGIALAGAAFVLSVFLLISTAVWILLSRRIQKDEA